MDVDLDFPSSFDPVEYFQQAVRASIVKKGELTKHPVGAYLQNIPRDPVTQLSAIPYEEAEQVGYFKIDFLHLSLLDDFATKEEIRTLLKIEPDWTLLQDEEQVTKLFQIHKHFKILTKIKPTSVQELADCIALIRPGKRHLLDAYTKNKLVVRQELYRRPDEEGQYYFKKGHAVAYALNIILQLHLIKGGIL